MKRLIEISWSEYNRLIKNGKSNQIQINLNGGIYRYAETYYEIRLWKDQNNNDFDSAPCLYLSKKKAINAVKSGKYESVDILKYEDKTDKFPLYKWVYEKDEDGKPYLNWEGKIE